MENSTYILIFTAVLIVAGLAGWFIDLKISNQLKVKKQPLNILISVIIMAILFIIFGATLETIKGFILFLLLQLASNSDIQIRQVENNIPVMIAITALIGITMNQFPSMLLGVLVITIPQLAIEILKPGSIGGADIKITAACALLLGLEKGLVFILAGLIIAVISTTILKKIRRDCYKEPFALVPYLSVGCFIAYLL